MPYTNHNGQRLHYVDVDRREDKTKGLSLVLVHGAGSSHLSWALAIRALCSRNRVVAVDLSGHGKSDPSEKSSSIDKVFVEEVGAVISHLGLEDFVLAGHSMGGVIAMCYALRKDLSRPRGLVLVDTSASLDLTRILPGLVKEVVDERIRPISVDDKPDAATIKRYEEQVILSRPGVMQRDLAACAGFDISHRLKDIDIPTFVLVGENDDIITPKMAAKLKEALPRADLAVVKGAHHIPMLEAPDVFNQLLSKFVDWLQRQPP